VGISRGEDYGKMSRRPQMSRKYLKRFYLLLIDKKVSWYHDKNKMTNGGYISCVEWKLNLWYVHAALIYKIVHGTLLHFSGIFVLSPFYAWSSMLITSKSPLPCINFVWRFYSYQKQQQYMQQCPRGGGAFVENMKLKVRALKKNECSNKFWK